MRVQASSDTLRDRTAFLREVALFAGIQENGLHLLAQDLTRREYPKRATIFWQGDTSQTMYVIQDGEVLIYRSSLSGETTSIDIFTRGDVIGEFAALDSMPRSATAEAVSRCALLEMRADRLLQRMREMPDLAINMCRLLSSKLRWTAGYAETVAQLDASDRLLHILLLLGDRFGKPSEDGKSCRLDIALTQSQYASLVGSRREWVNRIFHEWRDRGLIEFRTGEPLTLNLGRLEAERDQRAGTYRTEGGA